MSTVWQDLRFGLRALWKHPGFTSMAVLMLGLGVGVNTTVFCWLQTSVLHPLPGVSDSSRVKALIQADGSGTLSSRVSYPDFRDLAGLKQVFSGVIGTSPAEVILGINGRNEWVNARVATANTFAVLGVNPEYGRSFVPDEDQGEGGHPIILVSHRLWKSEFGGKASAVGSAVRLNQQLFTVVGVLPPEFHSVVGGAQVDVWAPLSMHEAVLNYGSYASRSFRWIQPLARLRPGVGELQAGAALATLSSQLQQAYAESNRGVHFELFPLWKSPFAGQAQFMPVLRILLAVSLGVLLIVAVNISCLLLARGAAREKEIAVRVAIGAGRWRLVRQMLTESLLLAGLGGCLAWCVALFGVRLLAGFVLRASGGCGYPFRLDIGTLAFLLLLTALSAVLFGLVPALRSSRTGFLEGLKAGRGSSLGLSPHRTLQLLVGSEMAIALVLLIAAGLCLRGFGRARHLDLGFNPHDVLYARLNLVPNNYSAQRAREFDQALRSRLTAVPGMANAAFVNTAPLGPGGTFSGTVDVPGHTAAGNENRLVSFIIASPGYFDVLRTPILSGRDFSDADDQTRSNVAIVNQSMARHYWPGLDPIGRQFRIAVGIAPTDSFTVIGVTADGKYNSLNEPATPLVYVTYLQRPIASLYMNLIVRTRAQPLPMVASVRNEIHALDREVEPVLLESLEDYTEPAFLPVRIASWLLAILGSAALLLAALGLYGVMAYAVAKRRGEIGIRMALGAQVRDMAVLVVKQGLGMAGWGAIADLLTSLALTRLLSGFLYGINPRDPLTFGAAALVLILIALLASYLPARHAMRVDPMIAIREE